jgi:sugar phosphate isomerase/epimerase
MMRPSIWSSYLIELSPEEMVTQFAAKGWECSELSDEHGAVLLQRGDPAKVGRALRLFAQEHGFSFPQGHLWLMADIAGPDQPAVLDQLKRWLDLFLALGIRAGVLHPGGHTLLQQGNEPALVHARRVHALQQLADYVRGTPFTICLENVSYAPEVEDLLALIEAVGSPHVGICLDTGHLNLASGQQGRFIRRAGPLLQALHIADNEGQTDQHLMPYGRGTVPWDEVVSALKEAGYQGLFNLEIPGENRCPLQVRLAKLDYLRTLTHLMLNSA